MFWDIMNLEPILRIMARIMLQTYQNSRAQPSQSHSTGFPLLTWICALSCYHEEEAFVSHIYITTQ